ncbi:MAG TPA: helical backbone metal receptor [Candidatus Bathyarchaeia archaeon]|nr:helical backbone metal receptor [Candidatus Bathyarchaeia archaeon]
MSRRSRGPAALLILVACFVSGSGAWPSLTRAATVAAEDAEAPRNPRQTPPSGGARRVVSLVPSVTETVFALGEGARLVGVSTFCDWPPEARSLPRIGSYLEPAIEPIIALRPDVVIGVPTPGNQAAIARLRALGLTVVIVGETTLDDAWASMRTIGDWVDRRPQADALVARVQDELAQVRRRAAAAPPLRVLFVVGHDPLVAAGSGLFIDELITIAGGMNVAAKSGGKWPRLSLEAVVEAAPEVIIDGAMGSEESSAAVESYWQPYRSLPAVRAGRVIARRSDEILRPGPRLGAAARELEEMIHRQGSSPPSGAS